VPTHETPLATTFADIDAAAKRLHAIAHRTPVITSATVDALTGATVFFKCENLQRTGSFKFRGAYNRLAQFTPAERRRGVVTHSSGNHAQGIALSAKLLRIPATVVMNSDAPASKIRATRDYGAEVVLYDRHTEDREAISHRIRDERGAILVPPYDDPNIIAGQGTAALELIADAGPLDAIVTPLGGGGLLSGSAIAAKALLSAVQVYGIETEAANDWALSLAKGAKVTIAPPDTIADGIRTQTPGELTWPIVCALVHGVELVSEAEVKDAVRFMLLRLKLLVEPSGAVPLAWLLSCRAQSLRGRRIGVIVSGGNIDAAALAAILSE
jgi:threo-3-hydroxy-L-aspartate ammonia-lyase